MNPNMETTEATEKESLVATMAASTALLSEHGEHATSPPGTLSLACTCSMGHGNGEQGDLPHISGSACYIS